MTPIEIGTKPAAEELWIRAPAADAQRTIAVLYADAKGVYSRIDDDHLDVWTEKRDARLYPGPHPVVAHPPCKHWSIIAPLVQSLHPWFRVGNDDDCFKFGLAAVRTYGGVLEHPAYSKAWPAFGLMKPMANVWTVGDLEPIDSWVAEVAQRHWGHRARKRTWLYAVRPGWLPSLPEGDGPPVTAAVGAGREWLQQQAEKGRHVEHMTRTERIRTPEPFAHMLIDIARCTKPRNLHRS